MFNIFHRKKTTPTATPKKIIYYKSNEDAFHSACDWMDTSLKNENKVVAIVLHATGKHNVPADELFMVKLSNGTDPNIPNDTPDQLFGRVGKDIAFAKKIDNVPELTRGDLVIYVQPREMIEIKASLGTGIDCGIIIAKLKPVYDVDHGGWMIERA
jgi:hypothetical protein